jgi:hypothetical protein
MKKSDLKASIREMIIDELTMVDKNTNPAEIKDEDPNTVKTAVATAKKTGKPVTIAEEEQLDEMAKIAGDLKSAIEKVIKANADAEKKDVRKAVKADDKVIAALGDEDLFDNQLNKFIDLVRGEREVGQRGRKASEEPKEKKEKGTRGRPKSATPAAKKKEAKPKTFSVGKKKYYAGGEDEEGPSDKELKQLARSGGKFDKSKLSQLRQQEKTKMIKSWLKTMVDKGVVDSANRILDKDAYAKEWADAKVDIEAKVAAIK